MTIFAFSCLAAGVLTIGFAVWLTRRDFIDDLGDDKCQCGHPWSEHYGGRWCLMDGCECDLSPDDDL